MSISSSLETLFKIIFFLSFHFYDSYILCYNDQIFEFLVHSSIYLFIYYFYSIVV